MTTFRIGELASKGNVNLETIRYYEREGLMRPPRRTPSGHRAYAPGDVLRLRFIRQSQALGFTLTEIKELLALRVTPNRPCIGVVRQIEVKAREVKAKIARLQAIERTLDRMKASCKGRCAVGECPILESLDSGLRS
ncbi:MAG TPA: heavy metal-responsive transcriptional regulator [Bryobacteraceae bacterium]|nr:heavy metal-responsive transcriptional regulator [Bryobacteraceae bacterium]